MLILFADCPEDLEKEADEEIERERNDSREDREEKKTGQHQAA